MLRPKTKMHKFTTMQVRSFAQAQSPIFPTPNPCCFMHRFFCRRCAWCQLGHPADDDLHGAHHQSVMVWCRRHIVLSFASTRVAHMYGRCKSWIEHLCGVRLIFFGLRQALSFWRLADPGPNEPCSLRIRFTGSPKASCFHFYAGRHAVASCCMRCPC